MMKKILALALAISLISTSSAFAYRWVDDGHFRYVVDESTGEFLENVLLDVGNEVYYLNKEGKMVTGWWRNDESGKYYFFSNRIDKDYGGMLFGLHVIDGYTRYFNDDGSLAVADEITDYKKVYGEYYADYQGKLYYANQLLRDVSNAKSEFYTDPIYYSQASLNNYFLANFDLGFRELVVVPVKEKHVVNNNVINNNVIRSKDAASSNTENQTSKVSLEITPYDGSLEKIGPRANMD